MNPKLRQSVVVKIFLGGIIMLAAFLIFLVLSWLFFPTQYAQIIGVSVSNVMFGRAAGITVGFAAGMDRWSVISLNVLVESILVLILYPLFVLSWSKLLHNETVYAWVSKSHRQVEKYRPTIQRYGAYGLFAFVWFPFWMTGPVPGSFLGYLMGLRHSTTLIVVILGTFVATVGWAYALEWFQAWASEIDPRAPWIIVSIIIALVIIGLIWKRLRKENA